MKDGTALYPAIPSITTAGYHGQLGLLVGESPKKPVSLIIGFPAAIIMQSRRKKNPNFGGNPFRY